MWSFAHAARSGTPWRACAFAALAVAAAREPENTISKGNEKISDKAASEAFTVPAGSHVDPAAVGHLIAAVRQGQRIDEGFLQHLAVLAAVHFRKYPNVVRISLRGGDDIDDSEEGGRGGHGRTSTVGATDGDSDNSSGSGGRNQSGSASDGPLSAAAAPTAAGHGRRLHVFGDIHGQLSDLLRGLDACGMPSGGNVILVNGDFTDRGPHQAAVAAVLLAMALAWPGKVFLNRGNHECDYMNRRPGGSFYEELKRLSYSDDTYELLAEAFRQLPLAAVVDGEILIAHAGPPGLRDGTMADLERADRAAYDVPGSDDIIDGLLWSDPDPSHSGWRPNRDRGCGATYGSDAAAAFLARHGLTALLRSHESVDDGFAWAFGTPVGAATPVAASSVPAPATGALLPPPAAAAEWDGGFNGPHGALLRGCASGCVGTIFSASDFDGEGNFGAVVTLLGPEAVLPPGASILGAAARPVAAPVMAAAAAAPAGDAVATPAASPYAAAVPVGANGLRLSVTRYFVPAMARRRGDRRQDGSAAAWRADQCRMVEKGQ